MSIPGLTIIGERINPGFASSRALLEDRDIDGLQKLAVAQVQKGATYLTINVGDRAETEPAFMADLIKAVQDAVDVPLSFDYPARHVQELCLRTYDPAKARGRKPIMNSVSELRWDMLDLLGLQPFRVVLMASERLEKGVETANTDPQSVHATARRMADRVLAQANGMTLDDLLVDVSIGPLGTDTESITRRAIDSIKLIGADPALRGIHMLVGLSNLSIMLPRLARDGSPLKVQIESSFLTLTMPHGLDTILGTPGREYQILADDNDVLRGFKEAIAADGFDTLLRVQELYAGAVA